MASIWDSPYSLFKVGSRKGKTRKEIEAKIKKEKEDYQKKLDKNNKYLAKLREDKKHPDSRKTRRNRS